MHRLERWRDAAEETRRALRRREPAPSDPAGLSRLRDWAWEGLDRIAWISYRVEKPEHEVSEAREATHGRVLFAVGGYRTDGTRIERSADVLLSVEWDPRRDPTPAEAPPGPAPESVPIAANVSVTFDRLIAQRENGSPRFHDATAEAGLGAPRHDPPLNLTNRLIAGIWPGSGVAVLDFDGDGFEDLFVADGVRSILYKNDGRRSFGPHGPQDEQPRAAAVHFTDVTVEAGLATRDGKGIAATGVAAGDVDGDGFPDLFVTDAFGPARLFRNRADGTFEEITATSGISVVGNARSAAFADVDGDGDLDLFVCVAGDYYREMPDPPYDANDGLPNRLYLNDGHGHFTDATAAWGLDKATRWSLSSLFADYDGDGRHDLLVTNDFGFKNLYRNDGGRRFEDVTKKAGAEVRAYGMSGAWADFDSDGLPDLYTTGCDTQWYFLHEYPSLPIGVTGRMFLPIAIQWVETMTKGNTLLLQQPDHTFADATSRSGAAHAGWNWSAVAADLDNDSWPDIYATNGMWGDGRDHDRELEFWWQTLAYWDDYVAGIKTFDRKSAGIAGIERDRYFRNRSGDAGRPPADAMFEERSFLEGLDLESNGRAAVAFDANNDGALDLYVRSVQAPEALFLGSRRSGEHNLRVKFRGTPGRDNRDGVGARITAILPGGRYLVLETGNASGYLSTASTIAHLGLGKATRIDSLTVRWPSGKLQDLGRIDTVDRILLVDEDRGVVPSDPAHEPWSPASARDEASLPREERSEVRFSSGDELPVQRDGIGGGRWLRQRLGGRLGQGVFLRALLDLEQHLALHEELTRVENQRHQQALHAAWKPRPASGEEPGGSVFDGKKGDRPGRVEVRHRRGTEDDDPVGLGRLDDHVACPVDRLANLRSLELWKDSVGVDDFHLQQALDRHVAVEAASRELSHLSDPGPDLLRNGPNRDRPVGDIGRLKNLIIEGQGPDGLLAGGVPAALPRLERDGRSGRRGSRASENDAKTLERFPFHVGPPPGRNVCPLPTARKMHVNQA